MAEACTPLPAGIPEGADVQRWRTGPPGATALREGQSQTRGAPCSPPRTPQPAEDQLPATAPPRRRNKG